MARRSNLSLIASVVQLIEAACSVKEPTSQFARLERMTPEQLEAEKTKLQKMLLGDKAKANREAKVKRVTG